MKAGMEIQIIQFILFITPPYPDFYWKTELSSSETLLEKNI